MRTMGNFDRRPPGKRQPTHCLGCGRPVLVTAGKSGYCKKCIKKAKEG